MNYISDLRDSLNILPACSTKVQEKKEKFMELLKKSPIDIKSLRLLSFTGIPDEFPQLRSLIWKLLIGYLPLDVTKWEATMLNYHNNYNEYITEFV